MFLSKQKHFRNSGKSDRNSKFYFSFLALPHRTVALGTTELQREANLTYCLYWTSNTVPGGISASVSHVRMFSKFVEENAARFRHADLSAVTMPRGAKKLVLKCILQHLSPGMNAGPMLLGLSVSSNIRRPGSSLPEMGCKAEVRPGQEFRARTHRCVQLADYRLIPKKCKSDIFTERLQKLGVRKSLSSLPGFF